MDRDPAFAAITALVRPSLVSLSAPDDPARLIQAPLSDAAVQAGSSIAQLSPIFAASIF